jgi:hypothetical protein
MARVRIPGIGSGSVNRVKGAVAKASGAKPARPSRKATFVGRKAKAKAKGGRGG